MESEEFVLAAAPRNGIAAWRNELDAYYETMRKFEGMDISHVFMSLAAMSARASEIRSLLVRDQGRSANGFRTQEIDPFLSETDRQFKVWSRVQAVTELELRLAGGHHA